MGEDAVEAIPHLLKALNVRDIDNTNLRLGIQASVLHALASIGPDRKVISAALQLFHDEEEDKRTRRGALQVIGAAGPAAKDVVPQLITALVDKEQKYASYHDVIITTLGQIGEPAVQPILDRLPKADHYPRLRFIWALNAIGPEAKAAVPALEKELESEDRQVQREAAKALSRIKRTRVLPPVVRNRP
jgi:HEAT repeat protein